MSFIDHNSNNLSSDSSESEMDFFKIGLGVNKSHLTQGYRVDPVPYSKELANLLHEFSVRNYSSDFFKIIIPDSIVSIVGNEFKRYLCSVEAYCMLKTSVLSRDFLLRGLLRRDFADYLKKIKYKSFLQSRRLRCLETPDWWNDVPSFSIDDIGGIFNYRYAFFWEEEDTEDYKNSLIPCEKMDNETRENFKICLRNILPETIDVIDEREILLSNSVKSCMKKDGTSIPTWIEKGEKNRNTFSTEPLFGKRSSIPVFPGGYRDIVTFDLPTVNSIKFIEKQTCEILKKLKNPIYTAKNSDKFSIYENFKRKYDFFIDRDLSKEGLTKSREILQLMKEVLTEKYPQCKAFELMDIYKGFTILNGNEIIRTNRGHGLGMANALTTLMQYVIFDLIKVESLLYEDYVLDNCGFLAYNDDFTAGFRSSLDLDEYWEVEGRVLEKLRLIRSPSKSHVGEEFVFCEVYSNEEFNRKESFSLIEFSQLFACYNISHAKMLSGSIFKRIFSLTEHPLYERLISFWGFEFFSGEENYPASFGGWFNPGIKGVRLDLLYLDDSYNIRNAFFALDEKLYLPDKKKKKDKLYIDPLNQLYGFQLDMGPLEDQFLVGRTISEIRKKFFNFKDSQKVQRAFDDLLKRRRKRFEDSKNSAYISNGQLADLLIERFITKDFLIPKKLSEGEIPFTVQKREPLFFPSVPNPLLSYLEFFNPGKIDKKIVPDPIPFISGWDPNEKNRNITSFSRGNIRDTRLYGKMFPIFGIVDEEKVVFEKDPPFLAEEDIASLTVSLWYERKIFFRLSQLKKTFYKSRLSFKTKEDSRIFDAIVRKISYKIAVEFKDDFDLIILPEEEVKEPVREPVENNFIFNEFDETHFWIWQGNADSKKDYSFPDSIRCFESWADIDSDLVLVGFHRMIAETEKREATREVSPKDPIPYHCLIWKYWKKKLQYDLSKKSVICSIEAPIDAIDQEDDVFEGFF